MPRRAIGLKRPLLTNYALTPDEDEYLSRRAFDEKVSKSELIRGRVMRPGWRKELYRLRSKQKNVAGRFRRG